jgi:phosphomannomutase
LKKNDSVVLSIDCASEAFTWLKDHGFKPVYSKVGDVNVIQKAIEVGAKMGAERSGHYTFTPNYPYPDGLRAAAVTCQYAKPGELAELAKQFVNVTLIESVFVRADFVKLAQTVREEEEAQNVIDLDGVKAEFEGFSILIRQSNTEPKIRINVESALEKDAQTGMELAKRWVKKCAL